MRANHCRWSSPSSDQREVRWKPVTDVLDPKGFAVWPDAHGDDVSQPLGLEVTGDGRPAFFADRAEQLALRGEDADLPAAFYIVLAAESAHPAVADVEVPRGIDRKGVRGLEAAFVDPHGVHGTVHPQLQDPLAADGEQMVACHGQSTRRGSVSWRRILPELRSMTNRALSEAMLA